MKKRLFGLLSAAVLAWTSVPSVFADETAVRDYQVKGQTPDGSYDYEVWNEQGIGEVSFEGTDVDGGAFSCKWNDIHSFICKKGHVLSMPEPETYKNLGDIECSYEMELSAEGISKFGINGWMLNCKPKNSVPRLVEFYIVEGYTEWRPYGDEKSLGQVVDNGCTYDIYCVNHTQYEFGGPVHCFYQYFSIITEEDNPVETGKTAKVSHKIDIQKHFDAWEKAGMAMNGQIQDIAFSVEGWKCTGEANVTKNSISISNIPKQNNPAVQKGDMNGDQTVGIADVVLMQKWLLAASDTGFADWKAGDMNQDGLLNSIDLSLLKQAVFKLDSSL